MQIGDLAAFPKSYSNLVDKLILIVNAIITTPAPYNGTVAMQISGVTLGPRTDPAGNNYFGADFSVLIQEMQN